MEKKILSNSEADDKITQNLIEAMRNYEKVFGCKLAVILDTKEEKSE